MVSIAPSHLHYKLWISALQCMANTQSLLPAKYGNSIPTQEDTSDSRALRMKSVQLTYFVTALLQPSNTGSLVSSGG